MLRIGIGKRLHGAAAIGDYDGRQMTTLISMLLDNFLAAGIEGRQDDDGDITFTHNGFSYVLCFDADDRDFACLILPNVWSIKDAQAAQCALNALNDINGRVKLVKGVLKDDQVSFVIELWLQDQLQWAVCIGRAQQTLVHALHLFADAMDVVGERQTIVKSASGKTAIGLDRGGKRE